VFFNVNQMIKMLELKLLLFSKKEAEYKSEELQ